jgi:PadR family transcriptional regulator, regulatory protein PadR
MAEYEPRITGPTLKVLLAFLNSNLPELSGADIRQVTKLASGSLYPILLRLEDAGWLESRWEVAEPVDLGRPRRRLYHCTGLGARKAQSALREIGLVGRRIAWA